MSDRTNSQRVPSGPELGVNKPELMEPELIVILRDTLEEVEREPELDPKDPRVIEIKQSIRQSIAELEAEWGRAA